MKRWKNIIIPFILLLIINIPTVYAESYNYYTTINWLYPNKEYVINAYDIDIVVNENNTFDITENITAYFNEEKHGIYRTIPLQNTITRLDGTSSTNRAKITNLSVDNEYTTSRENNNYKIKIGNENKTITGEQKYTIKYTYNLGKDKTEDYDELYFNIIGTDWDTVIGNITFTITMPKEFDQSKLGFSSGKLGSTDNSKIEYRVDGNTITGSYNGILGEKEALTVRCELEEGYFINTSNISNSDIIRSIVPIIFLIISIIIWFIFGKDEKAIETVEFYPPNEFNSLEVGFLYKGKANSKDVTSLLIYLANKGYIKILEIEEQSLFKKSKNFEIIKLKDYDGNNSNERIFLEGLFKNGNNSVTSSELYNSFYRTTDKILLDINSKDNKNKILEPNKTAKTILIIAMIILTYCLITIKPVTEYYGSELIIFALLFPGIGFTVLFSMVLGKTPIPIKIFGLLWGLGFGGIPWIALVLPALVDESLYIIGYIIGIISIVGMILCIKYMSKRTKYGNEILGKLEGFKNFLITVEKDKLEKLVLENPTYFYDILPYTYVLGVSDKWIQKFEYINIEAPTWYDSPSSFNIITFGSFMNDTISSAQSAMTSSPSSSSSSSGGGSSGGGSGGGGGGSW